MRLEKNRQHLFKRNDRWVERDLADFRMASSAGTDRFVGWVFDLTTRVARNHSSNSIYPLKNGLDTPKTTAAECCRFEVLFL